MELAAAKAWGLKPSEFDACSYEDRLEMLAHDVAVSKMRNYEDQLGSEEIERARNKAR